MGEFIIKMLVTGGVFAVIDGIWLSIVANSFYKSQIGNLLLKQFNMGAAVAFYLIYIVGLIVFVISPALEKGSIKDALVYGALFGFVAYATYDLTNLATLKGYTLKLALVDMAWGTILTGSVSAIAVWILQRWT